jgi:hypothetical protein
MIPNGLTTKRVLCLVTLTTPWEEVGGLTQLEREEGDIVVVKVQHWPRSLSY